MSNSVLIVDDDSDESRHLQDLLSSLGYQPVVSKSGAEALDLLAGSRTFSAVILDLVMPDMDGMTVLQRLVGRSVKAPPVIVQVTGNGISAANSALRAGATDFLVKPATPERLRAALANTLRIDRLERELARVGRRREGAVTLGDLATGSSTMDRTVRLAERAARSSLPVLIEGESGVGKEQIARAIHNAGPRRSRPFVVADAAAADGAAADGADADGADAGERLKTWLKTARGGTLYLQAVGKLSDTEQRILDEHLGGGDAADRGRTGADRRETRIIAVSDTRLVDQVSAGRFREKLFYRLNVLPIWLPPLRERREDIPELANRCLIWFAAEQGRPKMREIAPKAMQRLIDYPWPGNDHELENRLYRAVAIADGPVLECRILAEVGLGAIGDAPPPDQSGRALRSQVALQPNQRSETLAAASILPHERRLTYGSRQLLNEQGEIIKLDSLEAEAIRFAIRHYQGRMSEVARRLGIGRSTLYRKLREYNLESERSSAA